MMDNIQFLKHIFNACDPAKPATENEYVDCAEARGGESLTRQIVTNLNLANSHVAYLFSGHIGCGKSSELAHLSRTLSEPNPLRDRKRFFSVIVDMHDYLDDFDVELTDILLAIVSELAHALREEGIELHGSLLSRRLNEVKEFFLSDVEINEGEVELLGAKLKIQRLKQDDVARKQVREALKPRFSTLLEEVNLMLADANLRIKRLTTPGETPFSEIVLILDGLDMIRQFAGQQTALDSAKELFLERYPVLTGFKSHIIYTAPLRLVRSEASPQLRQRYESDPFVLPMIKVTQRNGQPYEKGRIFLRQLIEKRLGTMPIEEVFTEDALEFLLRYSGGHARTLMTFIRQACVYGFDASPPLPLGIKAVQSAVTQTVRTFVTSIPENHWEKLARLDMSPTQEIVNNDPDYLTMLENLTVLEYSNGDAEADAFGDEEPWYAVNPVVRELKPFKAAKLRLEANAI